MDRNDASPLWMEERLEMELIRAARDGDREGLRGLIRHYQRPLYRMAFAMTRSQEEATALSVESLVKARSEIARLVEGKRFFPWLLRFTRSIAVTRARRRAGAVPRSEAPADMASSKAAQEMELEQRLLDALAELHVDEQMALGLRVGERLTYADIAALLDHSAGVTLSRLSSARGLLLMRTHEGTGDLS